MTDGQIIVRRGGSVRMKIVGTANNGRATKVWDMGRRAIRTISTDTLVREYMPDPNQ